MLVEMPDGFAVLATFEATAATTSGTQGASLRRVAAQVERSARVQQSSLQCERRLEGPLACPPLDVDVTTVAMAVVMGRPRMSPIE
jgi:hypothetical protein